MGARLKNKGLVYLRRSTSRQETGIHSQLVWAGSAAAVHGVSLDAAPQDLDYMLANQIESRHKAIFLDDGISGSDLNRPAFQAFREASLRDPTVSHTFIHVSDRFARPELAAQAMQMEIDLLLAGITVVFSNRVSHARQRGQGYFAEDMQLLFEYSQNGEFLVKLAQRVLETQVRLARGGYWNGGTPPYGFGRVLVDAQGQEIRSLADGEVVKMDGCHVRIKPADMDKISVWLLILHLHGEKEWGHRRIANHLTDLGVPSPSAGKKVRRKGRTAPVPGRWWAEVVKRLIRNEAIIGQCVRGKTATGKHRRFTPDGPRFLDDPDRREDGSAKWTIVPAGGQITAPTGYEAAADAELFRKCKDLGEKRGQSQRGIPRAHDPAKYPLSTRIVDNSDGCGATLYGREEFGRRKYECSRYRQSGGRDCTRNVVDAEQALHFILSFLRQRVWSSGGRESLRVKLKEITQSQQSKQQVVHLDERSLTQERIVALEEDMATIQRNMGRAKSEAAFEAIERQFEQARTELERLQARLAALSPDRHPTGLSSIDEEVDSAMALFEDLSRIAHDVNARPDIAGLLRRLDLKLLLKFMDNPRGRRPKRVVQGGVIIFGLGEYPISGKDECGGDHPPDADYDDVGSEPRAVGIITPAAVDCQQEGSSFRMETVGKPAVAPGIRRSNLDNFRRDEDGMIIKSYDSIDSLRFGISTGGDCAALYGQPKKVWKNRYGVEEYHYDDFILRFDPSDTTLRECTLLPYKAATFNEMPVTWDRKFLTAASREDGGAVDAYGFIVLPRLGIAVTGIHDDDKSQLAITVFSKGGFDKVLGTAKPFDAEKMTA